MRSLWAASLALIVWGSVAKAQEAEVEVVTIPTVDGVDLTGKWYAGKGGRDSACVMILHKWGSDSSKGDWDTLAKALQAKDYSVLTFDFRGTGKSKDLRNKQEFWNLNLYPYNRACGASLNSGRIDAARFSKAYYPWLINDVAAARKFLDERNDAGQCNSGKIFIIAEGDAAPLALMFTGSEFSRGAIAPPPNTFPGAKPTKIAGEDISGLIFLSAVKSPLGMAMPYTSRGGPAARLWSSKDGIVGDPLTNRQSMLFLYGEDDTSAANDSKFFYDGLFGADKVEVKDKFKKFREPVKDSKKLSGVGLLGKKGLDTEKKIMDYLEAVKKRGIGNNWVERDVGKMSFVPVPLVQILGFAR